MPRSPRFMCNKTSAYKFILNNGIEVIALGTSEVEAAAKLPIQFPGILWAVSKVTGSRYDFT